MRRRGWPTTSRATRSSTSPTSPSRSMSVAAPSATGGVVVAEDMDGAVAALRDGGFVTAEAATAPPVVFMFPGQGAQYPGMAEGLYRREAVVRGAVDRCARVLKPTLGADLRKVLFPGPRSRKKAAETLKDTRWAQPALFTVEYALAELWRSWGIEPAAMIGHSVGEFVAAALAGVMELDDALALIARRGQLISALPRGSMLARDGSCGRAGAVHRRRGLARRRERACAVRALRPERLDRAGRGCARRTRNPARRLHTSHAFHSSMMDPILPEFEALVANVRLASPAIPFVATLRGEWADGAVLDPSYWSAQLRETVRFADSLRTLTADGPSGAEPVLLEVGPGRTLTTFAAETAREAGQAQLCLTSLPAPDEPRTDTEVALDGLGRLVGERGGGRLAGVPQHGTATPGRPADVPVPAPELLDRAESGRCRRPEDPRHGGVVLPAGVARGSLPGGDVTTLVGNRVMVFDEATGLGAAVVASLRAAGALPLVVTRSDRFECAGDDAYTIDPADPGALRATRRRSLRNGAAPRGGRGLLDRRTARRHRSRRRRARHATRADAARARAERPADRAAAADAARRAGLCSRAMPTTRSIRRGRSGSARRRCCRRSTLDSASRTSTSMRTRASPTRSSPN